MIEKCPKYFSGTIQNPSFRKNERKVESGIFKVSPSLCIVVGTIGPKDSSRDRRVALKSFTEKAFRHENEKTASNEVEDSG
jgi:hypothetical protein